MAGSSVYTPNDPKNPSFVKAANPDEEPAPPKFGGNAANKTNLKNKYRRNALKAKITGSAHEQHMAHLANVKNNPQKYG